MGWSRASTMNLQIRYAKQTAALVAQAACFEFKKLLPAPFKQWTAEHLANECFFGFDGSLKVRDDTILITLYNVPESLGLRQHFSKLPEKLVQQGINPKVPWLFDFKVDFVFK